MKKAFIALMALTYSLGAYAQKNDTFNFGLGVNLGTNGVGLDASVGLTRFVQLRGGVSYVPKMDIHYTSDIYNGTSEHGLPREKDLKVKPNATTFHALLDFYPARVFHFTVGAYFGQEKVLSMENAESMADLAAANALNGSPMAGVHIGDNLFVPDANGNMEAVVNVKKIRPYVGIGIGRGVPRHHRVGCSLDLGVQYWGKPEYTNNGHQPVEVPSTSTVGSLWNTVSTYPVYPVLTFRICGRII